MTDADFRDLFARIEQPVEPRPEFVEQLLGDINAAAAGSGAVPNEEDTRLHIGTGPAGPPPERTYLVDHERHRMLVFARPRHRRRAMGVLAAAAAVIVVTVAMVVTRPGRHHQTKPVAPAQVPSPGHQPKLYWMGGSAIGRANLDGTNVVRQLISVSGDLICGITVDGNYVYWTTRAGGPGTTGAVARAKQDGTRVDTRFIITAPFAAQCVAVDGAHIYWTTVGIEGVSLGGTIGRANLDGTGAQESFISGIEVAGTGVFQSFPGINGCGLAVDETHIYWSNASAGTIGRANLDGTDVNPGFIVTGLAASARPSPSVCGVVVDGAHIYWGNSDGTIGRANLDGTGENTHFISEPGLSGSFLLPCAHDSTYLYWVWGGRSASSSSIGRARLDGTDVRADFITGVDHASGCAVGS